MLHNPPMAGAMGDAEKTDAPAGAWLAGLRAATRAIVDYALPPRCPGCGVIVGDDRQFCLACWSSLDFLGGPGCVHCSIPFPQTMPSGELAFVDCFAEPPPFRRAPGAPRSEERRGGEKG